MKSLLFILLLFITTNSYASFAGHLAREMAKQYDRQDREERKERTYQRRLQDSRNSTNYRRKNQNIDSQVLTVLENMAKELNQTNPKLPKNVAKVLLHKLSVIHN